MKDYTKYFELKTRDNGTEFYCIKDEFKEDSDGNQTPLQEMVWNAHDEVLPDDTKYKMVYRLLEHAREFDTLDDAEESVSNLVPIYNNELIEWLGSHGARQGYCDQAMEEGTVGATFMSIICAGYILELENAWYNVKAFLNRELEEGDK